MTQEEKINLIQNMYTKNNSEINAMANSGMFNEIIKGYCKIVAKELGVSEKDIEEYNFYGLFDEISAETARKHA